MRIDLSDVILFENNELIIDKKNTFVFGKNGTGKTTIAEEIRKMDEYYDVHIFKGFDDILGDKEELNAVILGKENTRIDEIIKEKNASIKAKQEEINNIKRNINEPEDEETNNYWTRKKDAEKNYELANNKLESFFSESASIIKNISNPQVADVNYNKNNFKNDIEFATALQNTEIEKLKETINTNIRIAPSIQFINNNMEDLLDEVNRLLQTKVEEVITIPRLEDDFERREFAEKGLKLHKPGDVCAFCGGEIKENVIVELKSYFSVDEVKKLQSEIESKKEYISLIKGNIESILVEPEEFMPAYSDKAEKIKEALENIKKQNLLFLEKICNALSEKQKALFEKIDKLEIEIPDDFDKLKEKYTSLQEDNNNNNIEKEKEEAKEKLRFHYIKEILEEKEYASLKAQRDSLLENKNERQKEFQDEEEKITGEGGLQETIDEIKKEIKDLQEQTQSEKKLADIINKKLNHMVSFELIHIEDSESKGFYRVKSLLTDETRSVTQLSAGEKNIIAFLYFIEKLNEITNYPSSKPKIIVFDDPMTSNDDGMQYLIIEDLKRIIKECGESDFFVLLTHNAHFYINVKYGMNYKKNNFIHLKSIGRRTKIVSIEKEKDDIATSYEALWKDLAFLFGLKIERSHLLLNPIRRIVETYTKFNAIDKKQFLEKVLGSRKLFDVNSHSIDDLEAELNGKTSEEIIQLLYECFDKNDAKGHFVQHWGDVELDNYGKIIFHK